jgi:glyoxylase-like metal-dependent hydrolase (beta-lactamase superfamily II)
VHDAAGRDVQDDEHVNALKGGGHHQEEIAGQRGANMITKECGPGLRAVSSPEGDGACSGEPFEGTTRARSLPVPTVQIVATSGHTNGTLSLRLPRQGPGRTVVAYSGGTLTGAFGTIAAPRQVTGNPVLRRRHPRRPALLHGHERVRDGV